MTRTRFRRLLVALLGVALALQATPALAADLVRLDRLPVAPGLVREHYRYQNSSGPVYVDVLRFHPSDRRVDLRPELGRGGLAGFEATHEATRRLADQGAVAGVNGHFFSWSASPLGEPRGYLIREGDYLSEPERGRSWRGAFGLTDDRRAVFGQVGFLGRLQMPAGYELPINGVQRHPDPTRDEIVALDSSFGPTTGTPRGTVELVIPEATLLPAGDQEVVVEAVRTAGNVPIPPDGLVLSATGTRAQRIRDELANGQSVGIRFTISDGWGDLQHAVQGGPLIIRGGHLTSPASWESEGFNPSSHSGSRHPRTIVAVANGGEMLLVTADGRTSRSAGLTMAQSQDLMLRLGAREAVHMDGGGSTTMVTDDRIVNDPCCDRTGYRRVASNLILYSNIPAPDVDRLGRGDRYTRSAEIATTVWPNGADTVLLASGERYPDGLSGTPLAHKLGGPLLLTRRDSLPAQVGEALDELGTGTVYILGGDAAISNRVVDTIRSKGIGVRRIAGPDRYATAAAVALKLGKPESRTAFVVASENFPDAVSAGAVAAAADVPVVLTPTPFLHGTTRDVLKRLGVQNVVIAGGSAAVSERVVQQLEQNGFGVSRVAGRDRYGTSAALADWARDRKMMTAGRAILASGLDFDAALAAGPAAAATNIPMLLIDQFTWDRSPATRDWLRRNAPLEPALVGERNELASQLAREVATIAP